MPAPLYFMKVSGRLAGHLYALIEILPSPLLFEWYWYHFTWICKFHLFVLMVYLFSLKMALLRAAKCRLASWYYLRFSRESFQIVKYFFYYDANILHRMCTLNICKNFLNMIGLRDCSQRLPIAEGTPFHYFQSVFPSHFFSVGIDTRCCYSLLWFLKVIFGRWFRD